MRINLGSILFNAGVVIGYLLLNTTTAFAKVELPSLFSDGMVLQQNEKVALWGKASGKSVKITTSWNKKVFAVALEKNGGWKAFVSTPKAGGPYSIQFDDGELLVLNDILVGEVWICSGQSNMEMPVEGWGKIKNYKEELAKADHPNIRLLKVKQTTSSQPLSDAVYEGSWQSCSPRTLAEFSAVAYFFARDIQKYHDVPIGLIQTAYSGTPAEAWVSGPALKQMKEFSSLVDQISSKSGFPNNPHLPTVLFNAMIHPLVNYSIRGVIWYQGEANAAKAYQYRTLFPLLIKDWREQWQKKDMPFYFVQLANFKTKSEIPAESDWAELREAQLKTLALPNTGMVVAIDVGDEKDIHPKNKLDIGSRLALIARAKIYREKISYSGPIYKSYKVKWNKVIISFNHVSGGLQVRNGTVLQGFEIAGEDKIFHRANAEIKGDRIIVCSDKISKPVAVRYAWAINPFANLYNGTGLPASPFRTDNWKGITETN